MGQKKEAAKSIGKSAKAGYIGKLFRKLIPKKLRKLNRSVALAGILSIVLVITGIFALAFTRSSSPQTKEETAGEITEIDTAEALKAKIAINEGIVEYKTDEIWEDATVDMDVQPGMSIKTTGAASRSAIELEDGSIVRLGPNSEIRFETLTGARIVIDHLEGHLYNRIVSTSDQTFVVKTENAQFQSLGTAFRTITSGDEEAVEVFQSIVKETTVNLQAGLGEKLTVKNNRDPSKDATVEKLDIELIKNDSFITWNVELDKQNDAFKDQLGFLSDFDGPPITISSPTDGSTIDVESSDTQGKVVISGNTERGARLTVESKSLSGSSPVEVGLDGDGNFTTPELFAPLGSSVFEFVATDRVGNKTTFNVSFVFNKVTVVQQQGISLTVDKSDPDELAFGWILSGMTTPDGSRLVYGRSKKPTLSENDGSNSISSGNSTKLDMSPFKDSETYYFRVCRYNKSTKDCDVYSNEVSVKTE